MGYKCGQDGVSSKGKTYIISKLSEFPTSDHIHVPATEPQVVPDVLPIATTQAGRFSWIAVCNGSTKWHDAEVE